MAYVASFRRRGCFIPGANSHIFFTAWLGVGMVAFGNTEPLRDSVAAPGRLAVMDLVDLTDNQTKPEPSEWLRRSLAASTPRFNVVPRDSLVKKFAEFNVNPGQACNNPQCSFDAGNYVQADFVLYGTYSPLSQTDAITLKLLYVPKAVIAWTWVGEIPSNGTAADRARAWDRQFNVLAKLLQGSSLVLEKPMVHSTLAVVDLSDLSFLSRVFFERVQTRVSGFPRYEPLSTSELSELFTALDINKYAVSPSLENMIGLGQKLGVSNLMYSRIYREGKSYLCRLAMYDIDRKAAILEMPPQPSEDFNKLLDYERMFFYTLGKKEKNWVEAPVVAPKEKSHKALWISLGLLGVGGGLTAVWVDNLKKSGGSSATPVFPDPKGPPDNPNQ